MITEQQVKLIADQLAMTDEEYLIESFESIYKYLQLNPDQLSLRKTKSLVPDLNEEATLKALATKHFAGYRTVDIPKKPSTVPDLATSQVLGACYGYNQETLEIIKQQHQESMQAENVVGGLLERYLDSKLHPHGWFWCCGNFVKAIDFLKLNEDGSWVAIQIKNRDNTENSSSSKIREGTEIKKWFRTFSKDTKAAREVGYTNWHNLPAEMQGYGLSEQDFLDYIDRYIKSSKKLTGN